MQQGPNEIHGPALYYKSAGPGHLGEMAAAGPGYLHGQSPDRPDQQLEARWAKNLRVYPSEQKQIIALTGGAELTFPGVGQLQADDVYFWVTELPPEPGSSQPGLKPHRMLARNNVHMNSERFSFKKLDELTVWFKDAAGAAGAPLAASSSASGRRGTSGPGATQSAGQFSSPLASQRFEISGRRLLAEVLLQQPEPTLSKLTIEENVRLEEAQTPQPGEPPLVICGNRLVADNLSDRSGTVVVTGQPGQPAHLEGRGLGLTGTNIHLDRSANRVWINGPGEMGLPVPKDLQARGIVGPLRVVWRKGMTFDGRTATFADSVIANTQFQQLQTQTMQVQLQRPVSFVQTSLQQQPQVENISCRGGVLIESRSFDVQQQLVRHDLVQITDFAVNVLSGALAGGPGWINSVGLAPKSAPIGADTFPTMPGNLAVSSPVEDNSINCLHVSFQKSITGNVLSRTLVFADQVKTTYGPVQDFTAILTTDNPDELGDHGIVATCDQLTVSQMLLPIGNRESILLEALGNTVVEGRQYTATGHRVTFDQSKDLLILEGTRRSDAVLYRQLAPGAEREQIAAQKLNYWINTRAFKIIDARSLQLGQPPSRGRTE